MFLILCAPGKNKSSPSPSAATVAQSDVGVVWRQLGLIVSSWYSLQISEFCKIIGSCKAILCIC